MAFKKTFFKNISSFAFFTYLSQSLEFFSTVILSRLLLPEEYGFVAIILIFAGFMQLFASIGIGATVVRSDYGRTFHVHLQSLSIWIGVGMTLLMMLSAFPIALFFNNYDLILPTVLVSFRYIFESFSYVQSSLLSKYLKFKVVGLSNLLGSVFTIGLTIVLAYAGFSYWSLIIPMIFSPILIFFYLRTQVDLPLRFYGWKAAMRSFKKVRSLMGHMTLSNFFTYWSGNADKILIGRMYTEADLGLYNRAFRFIMIATKLITGIFSRVLFPSLKNLISVKGNVNKEYLDIIRIITLFNMPIVAVLMLFPELLVSILWGQDWIGVAQFLPYIGIILIFQSMMRTSGPVFILYNEEKTLTYINFATSSLQVVVLIIAAFFSILHIIAFLTLFQILISLPIHAYYGFYKVFGMQVSTLLKFWIPIALIGIGLYISIELNNLILRGAILVVFNLILLWDLRETVKETLSVLKLKMRRTRDVTQ